MYSLTGRDRCVDCKGYIAVETRNQKEARKLINEILASIVFSKGVAVYPIREKDLGKVKIVDDHELFECEVKGPDISAEIYNVVKKLKLSEEDLRQAIRLAECLTSDPKTETITILFYESLTLSKQRV